MDSHIIVYFLMISVFNNFSRSEAAMIYSDEGNDLLFNVTLNPLPDPDTIVTIIHPNAGNILNALGTSVVIPQLLKSRIGNTSDANTATGTVVFTLLNVTKYDAGKYSALYVNNAQTVSIDILTLVIYAQPTRPVITLIGSNVIGNDLDLQCSSMSNSVPNGHDLTMRFIWLLNGNNLTNEERFVVNGSVLTLKTLKHSDRFTNITCISYEVLSLMSETSEDYTVFPKYVPSILNFTSDPKGPNINENTTVTLVCEADGNPPANVTISSAHKTLYETRSSRSQLILPNVNCSETGIYQCNARNEIGSEKQEMHINVLCHPRLGNYTDVNTVLRVNLSDQLNISGEIIANPPPSIAWKFKNSLGKQVTLTNGTENFLFFLYHHHTAVTHFTVVRARMSDKDFGTYTMDATNSEGSIAIFYHVKVIESVPNPPVILKAYCIGTDKAEILWMSNYNGGNEQIFILGWKVDLSKDFSMDSRNFTDPGQGKLKSEIIGGLSANTIYLFTVFSMNSHGFSKFPGTVNCTTKESTRTVDDGGAEVEASNTTITIAIGLGLAFVLAVVVLTISLCLYKKRLSSRKVKRRPKIAIVSRSKQIDNEEQFDTLDEPHGDHVYDSLRDDFSDDYLRPCSIHDKDPSHEPNREESQKTDESHADVNKPYMTMISGVKKEQDTRPPEPPSRFLYDTPRKIDHGADTEKSDSSQDKGKGNTVEETNAEKSEKSVIQTEKGNVHYEEMSAPFNIDITRPRLSLLRISQYETTYI